MMELKIGFLTSDLTHRHGWGHYSLSLINALRRMGVQTMVIAARNSPDVDGLTVHKLLPVPEEGRLILKLMGAFPQTRGLLRGCDLIHVTIEPYAPLAAWVAGKRPLVISGHGSYVRLPLERRWPVNDLYRRTFHRGLLVCVSRYTARVAQASLPGVRTAVINNGIDAARFDGVWARRQAGIANHAPTVLSVGAVKARKGTLELVRAIATVRQQISEVECAIIGSLTAEPEYAEQVRRAVNELGLKDNVHLLGHVPDDILMGWYEKADVFALPALNRGGKFEGYGLVYLEASAAGLPVIGTTDNGAEDAIDDGVTGLLVPQDRVAERLPEAIIQLLSDPAQAARLGASGREKARRQTWEAVAQAMVGLYNEITR